MSLGSLQPQAAPTAADLIKDTTDRDFAADVIQESMNQPVIVDFWAPWCGPCKTLGPALEKQVVAAKGAVKLVKINIDENPQIAGRLRIQSIPAVYAFRGGQPVDGFLGAVPESQVKDFIKRLAAMAGGGANEIDEALAEAKQLLESGELETASQLYAEILRVEPERVEAAAGLAKAQLTGGDAEAARATLAGVSEEGKAHEDIKAVEAALALADKAAQAGASEGLKAAVEAAPDDHQARYDYAVALAGEGQNEQAMDELLTIIRRDRKWDDEKARKELLTMFEALGPTDPLVSAGRRKLSAILFS